MRYRKIDSSGDYVFGRSQNDFLIDSTEAVAQAVKTRLALLKGEFFLDVTDGTDYAGAILGKSNQLARDNEIRSRIIETLGVSALMDYRSSLVDRAFAVTATIDTQFGQTTLSTTL